jgi:hypothetical protein
VQGVTQILTEITYVGRKTWEKKECLEDLSIDQGSRNKKEMASRVQTGFNYSGQRLQVFNKTPEFLDQLRYC